jgi:predicted nuclease of predicted toxin-antitoxin system
VKFLVDNQLPAALSRFLEAKGLESRHILDLGLDEASDNAIWDYAVSNGYTLISKDEDFFHLACTLAMGPALIWVRLGNCRKAALLSAFEKALPMLLDALSTGQRIVELR